MRDGARAMRNRLEWSYNVGQLEGIARGCDCWLRLLRKRRAHDGFVALRLNPHPSHETKTRRMGHPEIPRICLSGVEVCSSRPSKVIQSGGLAAVFQFPGNATQCPSENG
jgi:hypothetical protein